MNIQELSVGDWIKTGDEDFRGSRECTIQGIEKWRNNYVLVVKFKDGSIETLASRCFDPIPLTPEILEKNGWSKEYDDVWECGVWRIKQINKCLFVLYNEKYDYDFCVYIDTVHELQHALRLAGVGKEIEL